MRPIEHDDCLSSLLLMLENPSAEKGYRGLAKCYESKGMADEAEAVWFLIEEKFNADGSDTVEEQQRND